MFKKYSNKVILFLLCIFSVLFLICAVYSEESKPLDKDEPVGEFSGFGIKVPRGNYYFAKGAIMIFGTKWGGYPQTQEEWEERTWEDLLLSYEAFRRGINVEQKELEDEVSKLLANEKVTFNWKEDQEAYKKWVKDKTQESTELFENQLRHLIQLQKLRQQVLDSITPIATDEEAFQEFLNEYNTLSVELAQFEKKEDAQAFYAKVKKNPKLWDKEVKENPKLFRRPGFVALEFLMEMWKFPKDDVYKMLKLKIGDIYPPTGIYGGKTGVFKIMEKRIADESKYPGLRESYHNQIIMKKKYEGLNAWIKKLKEDAKIVVYPDINKTH